MASGSVVAYEGKRGTVFRIVYREHPGAVQRKETIGSDRREAERVLRARLAACEDGTYVAPTRQTLREFSERFKADYVEPRLRRKTRIDYEAMLRNHILPELGALKLEEVTPAVIDRYVSRKVRGGRLSPKTINNHLRLLHVMLERAVKWRLIKINPAAAVDKLRVPEGDTDTLAPAEVRAILDTAPPLVALFTLAAVLTGGRLNEVLSVTWDRVDFDAATLRLDRQWTPDGWAPLKSRKRTHAMPAELWQPLLDHHAASPYNAPDDFVFASRTGRKIDGRNMARWFKTAAISAGVTRRVYPHQLRHTAGTRAAELGLSSLEVAALLGHAQASTSERYVHLAQGASAERAEQLAQLALGVSAASSSFRSANTSASGSEETKVV
jgi:integrase